MAWGKEAFQKQRADRRALNSLTLLTLRYSGQMFSTHDSQLNYPAVEKYTTKSWKSFMHNLIFWFIFFFLSISYTENVDCLCSGNHSKPFSRDRRFRKAGLLTSVFGLSCNCWLLKGSVNLIYLPCPHQCFNHLPSAARTLTLKHLQHSGRQEQTEI